jgi:mono/diheme cytochrome c family protein
MIRIVLHGLSGPITVAGKSYTLEMPALAALKDDDIAAALTYVRRSWENEASPVTAEQVRRVRENVKRAGPWSERELLRVR